MQESLDRLEAEPINQSREIVRRFTDDESPDSIADSVGYSPRRTYRVMEDNRKGN